MFPGIDGFHWAFGHILFLALFFIVAATIFSTLAFAVWRTSLDFRTHRAIEFCWTSQFAELPVSERRCRHELAGRVIARTCDNAFNCRDCQKYGQFVVLPATGRLHSLGLRYPDDRFYHRGHTWVHTEGDGTLTIGLDDLANHLVGSPDFVQFPKIGERIDISQTAWRMKKNGKEIAVRAPIEGEVIATGDSQEGWFLKLRPSLDIANPITFRHLLTGPEVHGWISRELERLQLQLRSANTPPALADGGTLVPELMNAVPSADWDTVLAETFLEP